MFFFISMSCVLLTKINDSLITKQEVVQQENDRANILNKNLMQTISFSGKIIDNIYIDKENGLKVPVNEALFEIGHNDSNRKLKAVYTNFVIEYWFFDDILVQRNFPTCWGTPPDSGPTRPIR